MSTIKDYSIIETEWLDEKINKITELDEANFGKWTECLIILKEIKSKLKPLTPIVENAFVAGENYQIAEEWHEDYEGEITQPDKENYINTTIIE